MLQLGHNLAIHLLCQKNKMNVVVMKGQYKPDPSGGAQEGEIHGSLICYFFLEILLGLLNTCEQSYKLVCN